MIGWLLRADRPPSEDEWESLHSHLIPLSFLSACRLNVWILKLEASNSGGAMNGVAARIHGVNAVGLRLLRI
jgi:hypothetical protein